MSTPTNGDPTLIPTESLTRQHQTETDAEYVVRVQAHVKEQSDARANARHDAEQPRAYSEPPAHDGMISEAQARAEVGLPPNDGEPVEGQITVTSEQVKDAGEQHDELALAAAQMGIDIESLKSYTDRVVASHAQSEVNHEAEHEVDHEVDVTVTVTPIKGLTDQPEPVEPYLGHPRDSVDHRVHPRLSLTRQWDAAALAEKARRR